MSVSSKFTNSPKHRRAVQGRSPGAALSRCAQAKLLYTLLDAAEDEGRLRGSDLVTRWRAIRARFDDARAEQELSALAPLMDELDRDGALTGTWIQARWYAAKARREIESPSPKPAGGGADGRGVARSE